MHVDSSNLLDQAVAAAAGLRFGKFDLLLGYDVLSYSGLKQVVQMICRIRPCGLLVMGPPCGWWVFMSSSVHGRTNANPEGHTWHSKVRRANLLATIVAGLIRLAVVRNVRFILEQPASSCLFKFKHIASILRKAVSHQHSCSSGSILRKAVSHQHSCSSGSPLTRFTLLSVVEHVCACMFTTFRGKRPSIY